MRGRHLAALAGLIVATLTCGCGKQEEIVTPAAEAPRGAAQGGIQSVDASRSSKQTPDKGPAAVGTQRMSLD
jgi:hypothetical protein